MHYFHFDNLVWNYYYDKDKDHTTYDKNETINESGNCFVDETFFSFLSPNGVIRIEGNSNTKLLVSFSTFLNCSNLNTTSSNGGCIYMNKGNCISYRVCSTKCNTLNIRSYCSVSARYLSNTSLYLTSIHLGNSEYSTFCLSEGYTNSVSNVNVTDNTAQGKTAFFVGRCKTYINYSYFRGNKATSSHAIFAYEYIFSNETYSCIFLNNSVNESENGLFYFEGSGNFIIRECIIKYNKYSNLIYSVGANSDFYVSFINCLIEGTDLGYPGDAVLEVETTNSLSLEFRLYPPRECQTENIIMNDDLQDRYRRCLEDKNALEFKFGIRPCLYHILTIGSK